ncbi:hypothetical protein [Bacteroides faecalis]|uniref:hypothetical protein n=1 Tax=Bacteroides faecalis TaxID=2447885 RepID=UPI001F3D114E|nr:hypothetical protein [Bacteroides faecalis]
MYTINIRSKQNPKEQKKVKLEMIFFQTGYARVPKVLNITGLLKDWDVKSQSFRNDSTEAATKYKLLFSLRTKYLPITDMWKSEEHNWSPVQLSHCFGEMKQTQSEVKVKSVLQMTDYFESHFKKETHQEQPNAEHYKHSPKRNTVKHSPPTFYRHHRAILIGFRLLD